MKIRFACKNCGRRLAVDNRFAGRRFQCPKCGQAGVIPTPQQAATSAQATPRSGKRPRPKAPVVEAGPAVEFAAVTTEDEGMDLTPMVDVVFLLLIFFMVTASYSMQKSLEMPPPDQQEKAAEARTIEEIEADDDYIIVRISKDNTIWVNEAEAPSEPELLLKLREARAGTPGSSSPGPTSMLVMADREADHGTVVMALDAGNAVGMENVRYACVDEDEL